MALIAIADGAAGEPETGTSPEIRPPAGRLAIVADGNSPDPDDIGATAVMFGLLKGQGCRTASCIFRTRATSIHS